MHQALTALSALLAQNRGASDFPGAFLWIVLAIGAVIVLVVIMVIAQFFTIWLQAFMAKASVSFWSLIGMRLRKVDSRQIVQSKITASQAGLEEITTNML